MANRFFPFAAAAAVSLASFGASPLPPPPRTAPAASAAGSITGMDRAKTLACQRFRQIPDGSWIMIGPVQANGTNLETVTFIKGTAEAAIISQRCLP
jgi:hypothetical protein